MIPYWQSGDKAITVYNERYEEVLEAGLVPIMASRPNYPTTHK